MVPTIPWMKQKFAEYNKKYFGGKLPTPKFEVVNDTERWGNFKLEANFEHDTRKIVDRKGNGTIQLTSAYSRKENAVESSLLHEMCHEYVYLVSPRIYPEDIHGTEFKNAAKLIGKDAKLVAAELPITDDDIRGGTNGSNGCTLCFAYFPEREDFKWWACKAERSTVKTFVEKLKQLGGKTFVFHSPSDALYHYHSSTDTLDGWEGNTKHDIAQKISDFCGDNKDLFDFDLLYKQQKNSQQAGGKKKPQI